MNERFGPGLISLFVLSIVGVLLVLRRAVVRGRDREPVRFGVGLEIAFWVLGLASAGGAFAAASALLPKRPPFLDHRTAFSAGIALVALALFAGPARALRGARLPGPMRAIPWGLSGLIGIAFMALTFVATGLPVVKGSRYIPSHEATRAGALVCGVVFLLSVLSALLPIILDRLEGRGFVSFVGARHVRATKSGFLTVISVLSICGVAVSSCALCSVVSIMGGFGQDLKRKILGNNAHVTVDMPAQLSGFSAFDEKLERVRALPGVAAATPVVSGEAMASSNANTAGILVRGIDTETIGNVIDLVKNIEYGRLEYIVDEGKLAQLPPDEIIGSGPGGDPYRKGPDLSLTFGNDPSFERFLKRPIYPGIVIGRELARSLHLMVGDEFTVVSPLGDLGPMGVLPRARKFRVAAIFYSGMYEYDATHAYLRMDVAQKFFDLDGRITNIDIRSLEPEATEQLLPQVREAMQDEQLRVRDWREMNKNLFSALKLERVATFVILSIAIAVASFCIICTLLLMVTEKGKEIAIMKALGASDGGIRAIFMTEGVIIGGIGTAFGVATGMAITLGLRWFGVRLDPDVYYIDRLPVATNAGDYLAVALAAMVICTLATVYPAGAASRLRPVDGLRYE